MCQVRCFPFRTRMRFLFLFFLLFTVSLAHGQVTDTLKTMIKSDAQQEKAAKTDSLKWKNEKTILNPLKEKQENSLYYKLNYAGHHLHRAGRNVIAVGGILVASVAAAILFNTRLKPKTPEDNIPINFVYAGLGLSFMICSTKGGYHLVRAGKSLKDPRFFNQEKTIYDL